MDRRKFLKLAAITPYLLTMVTVKGVPDRGVQTDSDLRVLYVSENLSQAAKKELRTEALRMRNDWEKIWGKMDSPETKARIEKTVRWLEKHTKNQPGSVVYKM